MPSCRGTRTGHQPVQARAAGQKPPAYFHCQRRVLNRRYSIYLLGILKKCIIDQQDRARILSCPKCPSMGSSFPYFSTWGKGGGYNAQINTAGSRAGKLYGAFGLVLLGAVREYPRTAGWPGRYSHHPGR